MTTGTIAKLGGKLPSPDLNGLSPIAASSVDDADGQVVIIARLSVKAISHDYESDADTVTYMVDHIEAVGGSDEAFVSSLLNAATERRTGKLKIDGWDDATAPAGVDPDTGEVL